MEYKQLGPRRLQVALTREELEELGLSYDALDYRDLRTRSLLLTLLVEVAPAGEGGCEIRFSGLGRRRPRRWKVRRHVAAPVVYAFDDVDTLIEGAVKLFRRCSHRILRSALYRMGRGWRLVVRPLDEAGGVTLSLLDEFAPRCGEGELAEAWLGEHAEQVLDDKAVDLICAYFG
ncbi:hypothetical protein [uncultured Anaerotruncus sp.]|uniref:hypothetical protein n=1 Tax=uncultured Anaerotruncus sp. TaxID=905011 RepID=UPI00280C1833|nr:hypothetical protein [uncultured Anaerotruncus sp.]